MLVRGPQKGSETARERHEPSALVNTNHPFDPLTHPVATTCENGRALVTGSLS